MYENGLLKFNIKKRPVQSWLLYWVFLLPFFFGTFIDLLNFPNAIKYTIDFVLVALSFLVIFNFNISLRKNTLLLSLVVIFFSIYCFIFYILNFQSPFYFLWGFRNNFRFFIVFFLFIKFFSQTDIKNCFKIFDIVFYVNFPVCLIQYFVFNLKQDYLGGVFGNTRGCNGYLINFFIIVVAKSVLDFMNGKEKTWICFIKLSITMLVSAMAELKFYFVVFLIVIILAAVFTSFSFKKLVLLIFSFIIVTVGSALLISIFDIDNFFSVEGVLELAFRDHYSSKTSVNRLSAISTLSKRISTEWYTRFFGMGLGNCDTSSFEICNTPFFKTYEYLGYHLMSSAILFLEVGYIGIVIYLSFFAFVFYYANKFKKSDKANESYFQLAMIMAVVCCILVFYNSTLRTEASYMVFFVLSAPFVFLKKNNEGGITLYE